MKIVAVVALVGAGQDLDQRRLAGAIVAEQADHLAGIEIDRGVVDRLDAAEGDRDVLHLDQRRAGAFDLGGLLLACWSCHVASLT